MSFLFQKSLWEMGLRGWMGRMGFSLELIYFSGADSLF